MNDHTVAVLHSVVVAFPLVFACIFCPAVHVMHTAVSFVTDGNVKLLPKMAKKYGVEWTEGVMACGFICSGISVLIWMASSAIFGMMADDFEHPQQYSLSLAIITTCYVILGGLFVARSFYRAYRG